MSGDRDSPLRRRDDRHRGRGGRALRTVEANIAAFGDRYPADTTVDDVTRSGRRRPGSRKAPTSAGRRASGRACSGSPTISPATRSTAPPPCRMWTASPTGSQQRHRPGHPRPRLPLHPRLRGGPGGAPVTSGRPRAALAAADHLMHPRARAGRHHPGLGRPQRPAPARPHHHRQPDEHAAAVLGQPAHRRRRATPPRPAGTPPSCASTSCARTTRPSTPSTGIPAPASRCGARPSRAAPTTRAGPADRPGASTVSASTTATPATRRCSGGAALRRLLPRPPARRPGRLLGPGLQRRQWRGARQLGGRDRGAAACSSSPSSCRPGASADALPGRRRPHPRARSSTATRRRGDPASNALLLHGVYDKPKGVGVDEGTLWGDYFYLEALTRADPAGLDRPTGDPTRREE